MSKTTLTSVFRQSQEKLREDLKGLKFPKDYAELQKIINLHIEKLLASDNDFRNSLNASDAELLSHALRMSLAFQKLSLSGSMNFKAMSVQTAYEVDQSSDKNDVVEDVLSLLPTVICAFINPWLSVAVGAGTVGFKKMYKRNGKIYAVNIREVKKDISRDITDKEIQLILSGIESLCVEIDEIISSIQADRKDILSQMQYKIDERNLERLYPQLLNSLQYLIMEDMKNEKKSPIIQNMIFVLQGYGYEVVEYSKETTGFFAKKINPNVSGETMYLPAIVKETDGGKTIAVQGIVYVPKV